MLAGRLGGNRATAELAVVMMVGPLVRTGRTGAVTAVTIVVVAAVVVVGVNVVARPLGRTGRKRAAGRGGAATARFAATIVVVDSTVGVVGRGLRTQRGGVASAAFAVTIVIEVALVTVGVGVLPRRLLRTARGRAAMTVLCNVPIGVAASVVVGVGVVPQLGTGRRGAGTTALALRLLRLLRLLLSRLLGLLALLLQGLVVHRAMLHASQRGATHADDQRDFTLVFEWQGQLV
jgi:hypothetical protein